MERIDPSERRDNGLSGKAHVRLGQRQTLCDNWIHRTAIFLLNLSRAQNRFPLMPRNATNRAEVRRPR